MLIRHGADINTADSESNTVLHVAAKYGNIATNYRFFIKLYPN